MASPAGARVGPWAGGVDGGGGDGGGGGGEDDGGEAGGALWRELRVYYFRRGACSHL